MESYRPVSRYRPITRRNIDQIPQYQRLDRETQLAVKVVSAVLPFRTNRYVVDSLIDWDRIPSDPIYQLTFPQRGMLSSEDFTRIAHLVRAQAAPAEVKAAADQIRLRLNPHPAGQLEHNVPTLNGERLQGIQHKYPETVLLFPSEGQTCHAYCTYCFRWAQFVGIDELKFAARSSDQLVAYLKRSPQVTDVLLTGGDPAIMKAKVLRRYVEPLLRPDLAQVQTIRVGTKALAYWPQRFVTDPDADDLLRLYEDIIATGRHVAIMAHFSHPRELSTPIAREAIRRLRSAGCEIRMQAPLVRHVNDDWQLWADLWRQGVRLGAIPYYMFVERDTGPKNYFEVPLGRAYEIFRRAYNRVSGLARTVRGPSMSTTYGKIAILGTPEINGERVFALTFLQGRNPEWVAKPFFSRYDPNATWFTDLQPAFGKSQFSFLEPARSSHRVPAGRQRHPLVGELGALPRPEVGYENGAPNGLSRSQYAGRALYQDADPENEVQA